MIKIENIEVIGWEHALRGMRNPMNSWDKSDSVFSKHNPDGSASCVDIENNELPPCSIVRNGQLHEDTWTGLLYEIGPNDYDLMKRLSKAGTDHRKFMRMLVVYLDVTAPLYWWKEYDTYKVGTVANSCSTMHKIHDKEFTLDDFSHEHLGDIDARYIDENGITKCTWSSMGLLHTIIRVLNSYRELFLETKDKKYWWQMIQLLPSSYNQKRTVMLNYEVLANIYRSRKNHKLDEWRDFCSFIESLPYSELITGIEPKKELSEKEKWTEYAKNLEKSMYGTAMK